MTSCLPGNASDFSSFFLYTMYTFDPHYMSQPMIGLPLTSARAPFRLVTSCEGSTADQNWEVKGDAQQSHKQNSTQNESETFKSKHNIGVDEARKP